MALKPKRPTLAKTALGWGTLKFVTPHAALSHRWVAFDKHQKHPLILQDLRECHRETQNPLTKRTDFTGLSEVEQEARPKRRRVQALL
jgi:hypothetical protein